MEFLILCWRGSVKVPWCESRFPARNTSFLRTAPNLELPLNNEWKGLQEARKTASPGPRLLPLPLPPILLRIVPLLILFFRASRVGYSQWIPLCLPVHPAGSLFLHLSVLWATATVMASYIRIHQLRSPCIQMCVYMYVRPDSTRLPLSSAEPEEHLVFLHNLSVVVCSEGGAR